MVLLLANTANFKLALRFTQRLFHRIWKRLGLRNTCVLCRYSTSELSQLLCEVCLQDLERYELGYDYLLKNPTGSGAIASKHIAGIALVGNYKWPFSQFIPSLKFHQGEIHAIWFAQLLAQQVHHQIWPEIDVVVPIPLHPLRQLKRGYNQSQLIAQNMPIYQLKLDAQVLYRQHFTKPQTQLSKQQRKQNLNDAFACRRSLNGAKVLLIDDVITTGNTVEQAAKVLKQNGATAVYVAAVAIRTLS